MPKTVHSEEFEQMTFIEWCEWKKLKFTAIPNNTYTPYWSQRMKNKGMGLRAGLPDVLIITPYNSLLFVELKVKGGRVSPAQREWIKTLNNCPNVEAKICWSAKEAIDFVSSHSG